MPTHIALNKVTLTYSTNEDRIQMTGEVSESDPLVFWLTRRMCEQLVIAVSGFIEKASPIPTGADKDLMLSFRQNAALIKKEKSAPVKVGSDSKTFLVQKIDLTFQKEVVLLAFYMSETECAKLPLTVQNARQWLGILYAQYQHAGWPLGTWPAWATESPDKPASPDQRQLMH
jgi:hypothetical protein